MSELVTLPDRTTAERCFDPAHRSYSSDSRWDGCQMRDRLLGLGGVDFMGPEAVVGSAVDGAVMDLLAGDETDVLAHLMGSAARLADPLRWAGWDLQALLVKATDLVTLWREGVQPNLAPVWATQLELHWELDGVTHHAHLDYVLDGPHGPEIIDLKTSEKRLDDDRAPSGVQLTEYAYGLRETFGVAAPIAVGLDGLIYANPPPDVRAWNPAAHKPWYDRQRSIRTQPQLDAFREDCLRREEARRWAASTGIYQTQGRSAMAYVCRSCPVISRCPSWAPFISPGDLNVTAA